MRRTLSLLPGMLLLLLALALLGCDSGGAEEPAAEAPLPTATAEPTSAGSSTTPEQDANGEDHDDAERVEHAEPQPRLAVVRGGGEILVLDLASGDEVARLPAAFDGAGEGLLSTSEDGRFVFVVDGDGDAVTVVDIGTWSVSHGTHSHHYTTEPRIIGVVEGSRPSHVVSHDGLVAVFFDGSGTTTVIDEGALHEGEIVTVATIDSGGPHHGVAVPYAEHYLSSAPSANPEALPDRVIAFHGEMLEAEIGPCPELHGEWTHMDTVLFACDDGVLLVTYRDGEWVTSRVRYPEMDEDDLFGWPNARAWGFFGTPDAAHVISWAGETYALIYDGAGDEARIRAVRLPAPLTFLAWAVEPVSGHGLTLAADGALHRIDPENADIVESLQVIEPFDVDMTFTVVHQLVARHGHAYVLDPVGGVVIEIELGETLSIGRTFEVGPARSLAATNG
jgi:hypothetical protein